MMFFRHAFSTIDQKYSNVLYFQIRQVRKQRDFKETKVMHQKGVVQFLQISTFLLSNYHLRVLYNSISMSDQLSLKRNQIVALIDKIIDAPILQPITYSTVQKLLWNFKNASIQQLFLQNLIPKILEKKEVILRLKGWVMIHLILLGAKDHETSSVVENAIEERQQKIRLNSQLQNSEGLDRYLQTQVELPFISFLKKLAIWKLISLNVPQTDSVSVGFSELNKIKEIMQLKKMFHNYSCYYAAHQYALNLFQACLLNIKCLWMSVCSKIKDITMQALKVNQVLQNQYLLIKQAEVVQDLLIEFVYGDKLSLKLPKVLLIKQINLLKTQIKQLENERKRQVSVQTTLGIIKQKKIRKLSTATVDTNKQTKQSPRNEQKLNTQQQIEIMDTINEMQILLSFQN